MNGEPVDSEATNRRLRVLRNQLQTASEAGDFGRIRELAEEMDSIPDYNLDISVRDTTGTNIAGNINVIDGRSFTVDDVGQPVMLVRNEDFKELLVPLGSVVTVNIDGTSYDLEIVGTQPDASMTFGEAVVPPNVIEGGASALDFQFTLVDVEPEHLNNVLVDLSALPLIFSIDISFIDSVFSRLINQFSALPILVGLLSLGAAAVIMANTVALATLERRRQIGILKAVGLKGRRVLGVMLLENLLISLLGGLLGVGLSAFGRRHHEPCWVTDHHIDPHQCDTGSHRSDRGGSRDWRTGDLCQRAGCHQRTCAQRSAVRLTTIAC